MSKDNTKSFFDHLDVCKQCEGQPFNLCKVGDSLLRNTASDADIESFRKATQDLEYGKNGK